MSAVGLLHGVHSKRADGIDAELFELLLLSGLVFLFRLNSGVDLHPFNRGLLFSLDRNVDLAAHACIAFLLDGCWFAADGRLHGCRLAEASRRTVNLDRKIFAFPLIIKRPVKSES